MEILFALASDGKFVRRMSVVIVKQCDEHALDAFSSTLVPIGIVSCPIRILYDYIYSGFARYAKQ